MLRPTLAAYFAIGAALSLVGLGIAGELEADVALLALLLSPILALGVAVSVPVRRRVSRPPGACRRARRLCRLRGRPAGAVGALTHTPGSDQFAHEPSSPWAPVPHRA